jgi:hypothetical protein
MKVTGLKVNGNLFILFIGLMFFGTPLKAQKLQGLIDEKSLDDFSWFSKSYESYSPDLAEVEKLKQEANIKILVFGGEWCPDTRNLLPKFYKTTDLAGINRDSISLYFLNHKLKAKGSPTQKYHISSVPTFIVFRNDKEIGRFSDKSDGRVEENLVKAAGL